MELTLAQAKEFLTSLGLSMPDFILQLLVDQANGLDACFEANGYPAATQMLIKVYLIGLLGVVQQGRLVTSESAPSGASRSYKFGTLSDGYNQYLGLLRLYDTGDCTGDLIPADPSKTAMAALFIGKAGC